MLERTARPLRGLANGTASAMRGFYKALGAPGRLLQDLLNGTSLGHSLHAVLVDVVIGAATAALFLDVLRVLFAVDGLADATTWIGWRPPGSTCISIASPRSSAKGGARGTGLSTRC